MVPRSLTTTATSISRQPCGDGERLVIGPTGEQVKLLDELAAAFPTQRYYILYILLLSHAGRSPGRYQSPLIECHDDLQLFIWIAIQEKPTSNRPPTAPIELERRCKDRR